MDPAGLPVHFSWLQVRMAADRTLLAWIRTGASLIAFGFALVQFFAFLETSPGYKPSVLPGGLRVLGVALLVSGTLGLIVASVEHVAFLRYMDRLPGRPERPPRSAAALTLGILVALVGIAAAVAIVVRRVP